jgi:hypothetical protein
MNSDKIKTTQTPKPHCNWAQCFPAKWRDQAHQSLHQWPPSRAIKLISNINASLDQEKQRHNGANLNINLNWI